MSTQKSRCIKGLSERTELAPALLENLSEEDLTKYFNRTSNVRASVLIGLDRVLAGAATASSVYEFAQGNSMAGTLYMAVAAAGLYSSVTGFLGMKKNKEVSQEIQKTVAHMANPKPANY